MTIAQQRRVAGFKAHLRVRGRGAVCNTEEALKILVEDQPQLQDPDKPLQAKTPVYTLVSALAGSVADPRAISAFTETGGRTHQVIKFQETAADEVTWKWLCEATRL